MRRLPIYFLIDVSESMVGEPIEQVQEGISTIITELKKDPFALETVWLSVIGFAGKSKVINQLQDVISYYPSSIPIGSGTSLSSGLKQLMESINKEVKKTTYEVKGDWKPLVFLFTDGVPTDDATLEINKWNSSYRKGTNLIAVSIGENSNFNLLGSITDNVIQFNDTDKNSYKEFFKWVSASIKVSSENINNGGGEEIEFGMLDTRVGNKVDLSKHHVVPDENYVVLNGKCSSKNNFYLIKFRKSTVESFIDGFRTRIFQLEGAYKINEKSYHDFSNTRDYTLKVGSDELQGNPNCPCCGNQFGLATCLCGGIHCISGVGIATCPWCGNQGNYGQSEDSFDINRTLG